MLREIRECFRMRRIFQRRHEHIARLLNHEFTQMSTNQPSLIGVHSCKFVVMKTVCMISIAIALFLSISHFNVSAGRFQDPGQQEKQKEKEKEEPKVSGDLGSQGNPVRCSGPPGERAYLNRLRCESGKAPKYFRVGSFGKGPYGHILDGYNVKCEDKDPVTVFMDMYHDHVETQPVPGFTIVNDAPKTSIASTSKQRR